MQESEDVAKFHSYYPEWLRHVILHSSTRTDAVILEALVNYNPQHPLVLKLAQGILKERKEGIWKTSQENSWAILSLLKYFNSNY